MSLEYSSYSTFVERRKLLIQFFIPFLQLSMVSLKYLITGLAVIETAAAAAAIQIPEPLQKALDEYNFEMQYYGCEPEFRDPRKLPGGTNPLFLEIFTKFVEEKPKKIFRFKAGIRYSESLNLTGLDASDLKFVKVCIECDVAEEQSIVSKI